jgi:hypothetical protein
LVDTSVWSLALRRDPPEERAEVERLRGAAFERVAALHGLRVWTH